MATSRAVRHQIQGERREDGSANHNMVLQFASRYGRPLDDTTSLGVVHRTTGSLDGVLLEQADFQSLSRWLQCAEPFGTVGGPPEGIDTLYFRRRSVAQSVFTLRDLQTTAVLTRGEAALPDDPRGIRVRVSWNGSGHGSSVVLSGRQADGLRTWTEDRCLHGWAGWRSGTRA